MEGVLVDDGMSDDETEMQGGGNPQESSVLWDRVASGELPPLERRLPIEPFVVGPGALLPEGHVDWKPGFVLWDVAYPPLPSTY